jgi:hypothetical protein
VPNRTQRFVVRYTEASLYQRRKLLYAERPIHLDISNDCRARRTPVLLSKSPENSGFVVIESARWHWIAECQVEHISVLVIVGAESFHCTPVILLAT